MKFQKFIMIILIGIIMASLVAFITVLVIARQPLYIANLSNLKIHEVDNVIILGVDGVSSANIFKNKLPTLQKVIQKGVFSQTAQNNGTMHSDSNWASVLTGTTHQTQKTDWNNFEFDFEILRPSKCSIFLENLTTEEKAVLGQNYWWNDKSLPYEAKSCPWNPLSVPPLSLLKYYDMFNKNRHQSQYYGTYDFTMEAILKTELFSKYASNFWTPKVVKNLYETIKENISQQKIKVDIVKQWNEKQKKQQIREILNKAQKDRMSIHNMTPPGFERLIKIDQAAINLFLDDIKTQRVGTASFVYMASTDLLSHYNYGNSDYAQKTLLGNVDRWLQDILNTLKANNYENYLLVLLSDHGHLGKNHTYFTPIEKQIPVIFYRPNMQYTGLLNQNITNLDIIATITKSLGLPLLNTYNNALNKNIPWWNSKVIKETLV